jgi:hypothetical protein
VDWQAQPLRPDRDGSGRDGSYERPRVALARLDDVTRGQLERDLAARDGDRETGGTRLAEGYTPREIACELQTSNSSILRLIAELQAELMQLAS